MQLNGKPHGDRRGSHTRQLYKVATPRTDDHQFKEEEMGSVEELSKVCSQIVLKCLYLTRIGKKCFYRFVNKLGCAITSWTRACENRLARLIFCHVGNIAQRCRLGLFQNSDCAGDLEDKINIRWTLVYFRKSHVRVSKLDVQETDFFFTQFNRS